MSVPITDVMETVLVHAGDVGLLREPVGDKVHPPSFIARARGSRLLNSDLVSDYLGKELAASFRKTRGRLTELLKLLQCAPGEDQRLAGRADRNAQHGG